MYGSKRFGKPNGDNWVQVIVWDLFLSERVASSDLLKQIFLINVTAQEEKGTRSINSIRKNSKVYSTINHLNQENKAREGRRREKERAPAIYTLDRSHDRLK